MVELTSRSNDGSYQGGGGGGGTYEVHRWYNQLHHGGNGGGGNGGSLPDRNSGNGYQEASGSNGQGSQVVEVAVLEKTMMGLLVSVSGSVVSWW